MSIHTTRDVIVKSREFIKGDVLDAGGGMAAKYKSLVLLSAKKYTCLDSTSGGHVDVVGSVLDMPFENHSFDTVICNQVFEHVPEPERLMSELSRVLRPGGHAIITAPFMQPIHNDPGDFYRYTPDGLSSLAARHGLFSVDSGGYGGIWVILSSFLKFIFFDPYKKQSRIKKSLFKRIDSFLLWLDKWTHPRRIFSDSYVIVKNKNENPIRY